MSVYCVGVKVHGLSIVWALRYACLSIVWALRYACLLCGR